MNDSISRRRFLAGSAAAAAGVAATAPLASAEIDADPLCFLCLLLFPRFPRQERSRQLINGWD